MSKPKSYLVRLKPYNKRRGFLCRNFMVGGVRFTTRWKEVSARRARDLEERIQPHDLEAEIPLFDIKTREQALAIEDKERDELGRPTSRVKEAEMVADSAFRNDRPTMNDDGEIVSNVEPAEIVDSSEATAESDEDLADAKEPEAAPEPEAEMPAAVAAPSVKAPKGRAKARK